MADMYGAVRSNDFTVKDVEKFKAWFETYHFGYEIELFISEQERCVSFGGYEQYPSAYPRRSDADGSPIDADLRAFAQELCGHLEHGEVFSVTAGGNEKLRYVSLDQLIIAQEHPNDPRYEHYSSDDGNDVLLKRLHGEECDIAKVAPVNLRATLPDAIVAAAALLSTLKAVAELRRRWRSQDVAETIDSIEYMDGLDALELDAVIAEAEADGVLPRPPASRLRAALTWLLDDITDAGEDRDPETDVEYDSVAFARAALAGAPGI
jgi:hypothetical protein